MKIFISIVVLSLIVFTRSANHFPACDLPTIQRYSQIRFFSDRAPDGTTRNSTFSRIMHNKLTIVGQEFTKCYFNAFELKYIYQSIGSVGLGFLLYFLYKITSNLKWYLISFALALPLIPILGNNHLILIYIYKTLAVLGLFRLLWAKTK